LLFAFIASLPTTVYAQVPASERRLWAVDLGSVPSYRELKLHQREVARGASVVFVDANTVAVTYRFADSAPIQATDSVSFFDADTGTLRDSLQWSTHDKFPAYRDFVCVLPTHNGEFLVMVGRSIRRYSASHKELNVRPVPNGDHNDWEWLVKVAPDGHTALMKSWGTGTGPSEDHWLFTDTLEDHAVVPAPFYGYGYGVGQGFVVYNPAFADDQTERIHIHSSTGGDRVLCADCKGANFGVSNDRIFFGGLPAGTGVVTTTDGKVLLRATFGREHQPVSQVSVARESSQFALYMTYLRGNAISRIVVLDTATLREVRRIDFEDPGEKQGGSVRFFWPIISISPDGTKLALLWRTESPDHHDKLEVFPLTHH
jgi:hypothetical protein